MPMIVSSSANGSISELPALYIWGYQPAAVIDSIHDVRASAMYPTVEVVTHRLFRSVTLIAMKIPLVVEWVVEHVSMSDYESLILLLTVGNIADSTSSRP